LIINGLALLWRTRARFGMFGNTPAPTIGDHLNFTKKGTRHEDQVERLHRNRYLGQLTKCSLGASVPFFQTTATKKGTRHEDQVERLHRNRYLGQLTKCSLGASVPFFQTTATKKGTRHEDQVERLHRNRYLGQLTLVRRINIEQSRFVAASHAASLPAS
jgi:hypothetical protein